jgi:hypothetical protein
MKQLIASVFIGFTLFFGLKDGGLAQRECEKQNQITGQSSSGNCIYSRGYSDVFNNVSIKETGQSLIIRLLHSFQRFPFCDSFAEKSIDLAKNNEISDYFFIAEFLIIRFEGPDIIHPYNYFW